MGLLDLLKDAAFERVMASQAAGYGDTLSSSVVDMSGYDSVIFIVEFGAITATGTYIVNAQQGAQSDLSDAADLEGSGISGDADDDDLLVLLNITRPQERYLRCQIDRATANVEVDSVVAIKYNARSLPITQSTSHVAGGETHLSPAEGTA